MKILQKVLIAAVALSVISPASFAQSKRKKTSSTTTVTEIKDATVIIEKEKEDVKSINNFTKKCKKYEGLFTLYQDTISGNVFLMVKKDQIDKEFIYFSHTVDGVMAAGHYRGSYRDNKVFSIRKYYNRIEFVTENTSYYFDPNSALSRAKDANINKSIMASQSLVAQNKDQTEFLIKADELFLTEYLHQVKPSPNMYAKPGSVFSLGSLSKDKSKYLHIKTYPQNTDVIVEYVYENPSPTVRGGEEVTDERFVSIKIQHSIIEMPKNDFKPRFEDPRIGYFTRQVTDMTSTSATPYRDVISRWNLIKREPGAKLSEPVEPIIWWIENTTPVEYRETIKNAVLTWNEAFEEAGFKNAVQVKVQPDDATWDAGDIRYNVLRWTSSPQPPFGGYGPSFVNPRTGEILGADVMLEFVYLTNRFKEEKMFQSAGLENDETFGEYKDQHFCSFGHHLHMSNMFGLSALAVNDIDEREKEEFIKASLYYLILHEVGHTLGLNHNMKASQLYSPEELCNKELTGKTGLVASVMDYPIVNISNDKNKQGHYFTMRPGPYDRWAIHYGYSEALVNEAEEKQRLDAILSRSTEPALMFGNDADDMRSPGKAIDPRVMVRDMSNDVIRYSSYRIALADQITGRLLAKFSTQNESYHQLRNAYLILTTEVSNAANSISRYIGGVFVDRSFVGQAGAAKPFTPVPAKDQKRAMAALSQHVFGPKAFTAPAELYSYLQMQRRGFNFFSSGEDPKIHDRVLRMQSNVLDHLLHPSVQLRVTDSEIYGNEYKLPEMMSDLTNAIFKDDIGGSVNTFRQNIQIEYVNRLIKLKMDEGRYDHRARSVAFSQLKNIERMMKSTTAGNAETKAHREHIVFNIRKALEVKG
jgi:predicted Zn-dependent protease with MMP-like domain